MSPEPVTVVTNTMIAKRLREVADSLDAAPDDTETRVHLQVRVPVRPTREDIIEGRLDRRWNTTTLNMETT